jgi:large subunit ribosomal protein L6
LDGTSLLIRPTFVQKNWKFYNVFSKNIKKNTSKFSGNISTKLFQLLIGSAVGFKKHLRLRGVGYKFTLEKRNLVTDVGFTHLLYKKLYSEILVKFSRKFTVFRAKSKDIVRLTGFMSSLRNLKKPDVYKGKGIRYLKENILYKEGKKKKN